MKHIKKPIYRILLAALGLIIILAAGMLLYFSVYYHATDAAEAALGGSAGVTVTAVDEGYLFDGSGDDAALIFYPGAKVEADAYAPLMLKIAEQGTDCFLCSMPLNFALFDKDRACRMADKYDYDRWFLAGHSLGGAAAAMLAESRAQHWDGLVLLAAYPTAELQEPTLSVYGSEDKVLNIDKYEEAESLNYWSDETTEIVIQGGNHAQFGDYGIQKGDGEASIPAEQQQNETAEAITAFIELETPSGVRHLQEEKTRK
jgi:hypothetical protein